MSRQEDVAVAAVLNGLGTGAFLVAQRPSFWLECGVRLGQVLLPRTLKYLTRRMSPEEESAWREAERRGQRGMSGYARSPVTRFDGASSDVLLRIQLKW